MFGANAMDPSLPPAARAGYDQGRALADLPARSGLSTEQLIYRGRAEGWLKVPSMEPH